jgi:hypothetical protein
LISAFTGFFSPVKNPPTLNSVSAGTVVPIRFSLGGFRGFANVVLAPGSPRVLTIDCTTKLPTGASESAESVNGLEFDTHADQYEYDWKTKKTWVGCRRFELRLVDGTAHVADFKLK